MVLQSIRDRLTGVLAFVILGILVIPFAFVGVNEYFSSGSGNAVAMVNEQEITYEAFNQSFIQYRRSMQQRLGQNFDPVQFEGLVARMEHLDRMVDEELLRQAAESLEFAIDDERLAQTIRDIPSFQVDGAFNPDVYQARVGAMGMSIAQFEAQLRQSAVVSTLPQAIRGSSFATRGEYEEFVALTEQTRSFDALVVPADVDALEASFSDEEINAWYEANQGLFQSEETVTIEYLELDLDDMDVGAAPSEEELRTAYEAQQGRFITPEQRRVSHILVEAPSDAPEAEVEAARLRADALAQQAREGEDFAALAESESDDIGSAAQGGDLGYLEPGIMAESFEEAAYGLTPESPISDPVQTSFGWHVIRLTDVEPSSGMSFEEAREVLLAEAREARGERVFLDRADRMVDIVYEDPTTLEAAALDLDLDVQTAGPFTRAGGEGVAANPEVVEAAFSELVLVQGAASDLIDLDPNHAIMLRVLEHEPVRTRDLSEVRDEVVAALRQERAAEEAEARVGELLARVERGAAMETVAEEAGLEVQSFEETGRRAVEPDPVLVSNVFALPRPGDAAPTFHQVAGDGAWAVVALRSVTDGSVDETQLIAARQARLMLGSVNASVESWALLRQLRESAEVQIFEDRLEGGR